MRYQPLCGQAFRSGCLGLERSSARPCRSRSRAAQRSRCQGQLCLDLRADRHCDGLDGMRALAGARADASDGGARRDARPPAVPASGLRHRQRPCVHQRDRARLLRSIADRVHALPALSQERPGVRGAEERSGGSPAGRRPAVRRDRGDRSWRNSTRRRDCS